MPLFEVSSGELVPFRRVAAGADLYESEIEDLVWSNLEEFTGEALFPIRRQPRLSTGGVPDIVALDKSARIVIFEIKRDIDRHQIAQCLEYAGWARKAGLDDIAKMYMSGSEAFFADWADFTESTYPLVINPHPRLFLVARDFEGRTGSAFDYLAENGVPVHVTRVQMYEDESGRRFIEVEGDHEPEFETGIDSNTAVDHTRIGGRPIKLPDLIEAGLLQVGDTLSWERPRKGEHHEAVVAPNGAITLEDGRSFSAPSRAAMEAAGVASYDGWYAWKVDRVGKTLNDLRHEYVALRA